MQRVARVCQRQLTLVIGNTVKMESFSMVYKRAVDCSSGCFALTEKNNERFCDRPSCDFVRFVFDLADVAIDLAMT